MGFRETYGGAAEQMLNDLVDKHLKDLSSDKIKEELHKVVDKLVDEHVGEIVGKVAQKLKAEVIDLIDGEDDIQ